VDPSPEILFDPSPEIAAALLAALIDPSVSFNALAAAVQTTPDALSLWLNRPEIRERIESTDRAATWRTRLIASAHLYAVPPALVKILQDFSSPPALGQPDPLDPLPDIPTPAQAFRAALLQARRAETTRKSAALLFTLTRQRPTAGPDLAPPPDRKPDATTTDSEHKREPRAQARVDFLAQPHSWQPAAPPPNEAPASESRSHADTNTGAPQILDSTPAHSAPASPHTPTAPTREPRAQAREDSEHTKKPDAFTTPTTPIADSLALAGANEHWP
jgi:hypothetical protein